MSLSRRWPACSRVALEGACLCGCVFNWQASLTKNFAILAAASNRWRPIIDFWLQDISDNRDTCAITVAMPEEEPNGVEGNKTPIRWQLCWIRFYCDVAEVFVWKVRTCHSHGLGKLCYCIGILVQRGWSCGTWNGEFCCNSNERGASKTYFKKT